MSPAAKLALLLATLALAGCKDINDGVALLTGEPTADDAALAAAEPVPEPARYVVVDGTGPMGETLATGPDCHDQFRVTICVDQPSPYDWWTGPTP